LAADDVRNVAITYLSIGLFLNWVGLQFRRLDWIIGFTFIFETITNVDL